MSDELNSVDLPSESETDQVVGNPEQENDETEVETPVLTKEQKKILELKAQKKSLTLQKYKDRQEKQQLIDELNRLKSENKQPTEDDLDAYIEQRVNERLALTKASEKTKELDKACTDVFSQGIEEYPDFEESVRSLGTIGLDTDTVEYITMSGHGAKMIKALADDLEEADRIMSLSPIRRAEALIELKNKVAAQPKKRISKTPEPIPSLGSKGGKVIGNIAEDFDSFNKWLESGLKGN